MPLQAQRIFSQELVIGPQLTAQLRVTIHSALEAKCSALHFASKWNPIEHRLFSEISLNWAGEPLDSYQKILNYARATRTQTGLRVTAYLDRHYYPCGVKPSPDQIASLRLHGHDTLPDWNYTIKPQL